MGLALRGEERETVLQSQPDPELDPETPSIKKRSLDDIIADAQKKASPPGAHGDDPHTLQRVPTKEDTTR